MGLIPRAGWSFSFFFIFEVEYADVESLSLIPQVVLYLSGSVAVSVCVYMCVPARRTMTRLARGEEGRCNAGKSRFPGARSGLLSCFYRASSVK